MMGLLLPDPVDRHCPEAFKREAWRLLRGIDGQGVYSEAKLRHALLGFIADFADWDNAAKEPYLSRARALVRAAYPEETPLLVDPFAGGGSIPFEALRIGCDAFASDLNPVSCLILRAMLEDIPRNGPKLAAELRRTGSEIKTLAEKELAGFYPPDMDGARPIAYIWARTVRCESPNCGAEIPLAHSFWLSKKTGRRRALQWKVGRPKKGPPEVVFNVFEPKQGEDVPRGTVTRAKATCPACDKVLPPERVRAQLAAHRGGADVEFDAAGGRVGGARLLAVVTRKDGEAGRRYRLPTSRDYQAVRKAMRRLEEVEKEKLPNGLSVVPDEPSPAGGGSGAGRAFSVQKYGMMTWGDLFTARQKVALATLARLIRSQSSADSALLSALAFDRVSMSDMSCTRWNAVAEKMQHTFGRQALPIVWNFAEVVATADAPGNWESGYELVAEVAEASQCVGTGHVQAADAVANPLPDASASVWFTDPPYYDAIPFADLSDFFFVWLKRTLPGHSLLRDPLDPHNPLTPKTAEIILDETKKYDSRPKDRGLFEERMTLAFAEARRVLREDGVGALFFAHKTTEGWEALLSGMIRGGWTITGSWPIATEMETRLRARESAALATSIQLVCRPRPNHAGVGDWADVMRELPSRIGGWMERLQNEGIRGADLVFACIGPAMEIYSRYSKVEAADGRAVKLDEFLGKVWEVLGQSALQRVLGGPGKGEEAAGAFEEDARLTALFLWTLQSTARHGGGESRADAEEDADYGLGHEVEEESLKDRAKGGYSLPFDIVRRFAQPLGIRLDAWEGRITETEKGVVRLLPLSDRTAQLFGGETAEAVAAGAQKVRRGPVQARLFPEPAEPESGKRMKMDERRVKEPTKTPRSREMTTLDRVHFAMLLQTAGQSGALRLFLAEEVRRGAQFLRLANALSALYPEESEEKRLLDALLLVASRR